METVNLKLESLTGNEIIIREGVALEQKEPQKIELTGDINTISSFLKNRGDGYDLQKVDKSKAVVIVDKENMKILLKLDPQNFYGTTVTGSLELSQELKVWSINQSKTFKREELVQLIKFNRLSFDNPEQHDKVLKAYMAFEAKTDSELKASNDTRGNKAASISKNVSTNIPTEFILLIPVFKGKEVMRFRVEICLDVTDGGARFWFESTELHELINTNRDIIFNEELKAAEGFVIINK